MPNILSKEREGGREMGWFVRHICRNKQLMRDKLIDKMF